jgi:hypothetical protein
MKRQSTRIQAARQLLGLALIGFVLWLAAIGWLPAAATGTARGGMSPGVPEAHLAQGPSALSSANGQGDRIGPVGKNTLAP